MTMNTSNKQLLTVETLVHAPIEVVWKRWTSHEDIVHWNHASDDWHTPRAINNLRVGGEFLYRMEAKDGSFGFDFGGVYNTIDVHKSIAYTLGDGRRVGIEFTGSGLKTKVVETFEAENQNSIEQQRTGWQAILNNFKNYTESKL
jgi:uncharacterized protein YndB with AHSA1/START domain